MTWFLFPGQGSQAPGMGRDLFDADPAARAVFDEAAAVLGEALLSAMFEGPPETLNHTSFAQPALLIHGVAAARMLAAHGLRPAGCAGHSLGEITALTAAGALTLSDALRLTRERARLMSENIPPGGMAAVLGLSLEQIEAALPAACDIANENGPAQTIISGSEAAIAEATEALKAAGAKRVMPLKVSGPFHSRHMRPAAEAFRAVLEETPIAAPGVPVFSSVTGAYLEDAAAIRAALAEQLCSRVRWTAVMQALAGQPAYEVGPGSVLAGLAKRADAAPDITAAGTRDDIGARLAEAVD